MVLVVVEYGLQVRIRFVEYRNVFFFFPFSLPNDFILSVHTLRECCCVVCFSCISCLLCTSKIR